MNVKSTFKNVADRLTEFGADSDYELYTEKISHGDEVSVDVDSPFIEVKNGYLRHLRRPSESSKFIYLSKKVNHGNTVSVPEDSHLIGVGGAGDGFRIRLLTPKTLWGSTGSTGEFVALSKKLHDGDALDAPESANLLGVLSSRGGFSCAMIVPKTEYGINGDSE